MDARHYSYDCKTSTQERPYTSRPSRTQQLTNPKLMPKLMSDVPDTLLRKKGIADEELARKDAARTENQQTDRRDQARSEEQRSRSKSSHSSASISSYSTTSSRSRSQVHIDHGHTGQSQAIADMKANLKRRRRSSSSMSYVSKSPDSWTDRTTYREKARDDSQRKSGISSGPRGHGDERRVHSPIHGDSRNDKDRDVFPRSYPSSAELLRSRSQNEERNKRRRHSSRSPGNRGRDREFNTGRATRRTGCSGGSRDRSEVTKHRRSMTPKNSKKSSDAPRLNEVDSVDYHEKDLSNGHDRYRSTFRNSDAGTRVRDPPSDRRRSLSPFSKRLAITQAMNLG